VRLPDFLGLGALKAGTTTLHAWLGRHPGVALPKHRKEVMFFDRHWERGLPWYAEHFAHAGDRRAGEISPNYLYDPACPARIAATVPAARLFVMVRDPVDRLVSQHSFYQKEHAYTGDLTRFVEEHPNAVERGRYLAQIGRYLEHFPAGQIRVLRFEHLRTDPEGVAADLLAHLGLPAADLGDLREAHNVSEQPQHRALYTLGRRAVGWMYDHDLAWVVDGLKRAGLRRAFFRGGERDRARPTRSPAERALLDALREGYAEGEAALTAWIDGQPPLRGA
jgi:hypothetical protein